MIDRKPALIARCAAAADVITALTFAWSNSLLVSLRGVGRPWFFICSARRSPGAAAVPGRAAKRKLYSGLHSPPG